MNGSLDYSNYGKDFYPTPEDLAEKLAVRVKEGLKQLAIYGTCTILEPSAGKGDLIHAVSKVLAKADVDFIEQDEHLRALTDYEFSEEKKHRLSEEKKQYDRRYIEDSGKYEYVNFQKYEKLRKEVDAIDSVSVRCIGDDFLAFHTHKKYDCILMNPPFSEGDKHLLKALDMQRKQGGMVVALLHAETIRNPYTAARKQLCNLLEQYNAKIEYLNHAFSHAERKTNVEIAFISVYVAAEERKSNIWEGLKLERAQQVKQKEACGYVIKKEGMTYIDSMIEQCNFEIEATLRLAEEYAAMKQYMLDVPVGETDYQRWLLNLKVGDKAFEVNAYLRQVHLKYWKALFHNPQFTGMLTSNLRDEFYNMVEGMKEYAFNTFNIRQIQKRMAEQLSKSYNDTILALFDKLSCTHSWNGQPEETNVHYYNGWATNQSWKINDKKVILPCYGTFGSYFYEGFQARTAYDLLADIEQTLNYLDNGETTEPMFSMEQILETFQGNDQARKIDLKYFQATFYKKGTCHIQWKNPRLVEKLNIFGSQKKGWLPPSYGRKEYADMSEEEKAVIDGFQGKEAYADVLKEPDYFLMNSTMPLQITG